MIIDVNVLIGFDRLENIQMDPDSLLQKMDSLKIDKAIICCNECMYFDFQEGNNRTYEAVKKYPDRFIGFFSLNTNRYIDVLEEVDRAINKLGMVGFRMFFTEVTFGRGWSSGLHSLMLAKVMEKISIYNFPVFIEAGYSFAELKHFAEIYPTVNFIVSGVGYANMAEAIIAAKEQPNLFLEISTLDAGDGIKFLVQEITSEKLLFGTSYPYSLGSVALQNVTHARIPEHEKENIFYKNIERILKNN
jgi:predicted TIM-barrel fold metal-dependent hydrolase